MIGWAFTLSITLVGEAEAEADAMLDEMAKLTLQMLAAVYAGSIIARQAH